MALPPWTPGLSGLIYLPDPRTRAGQNNRPYFVLNVKGSGRCEVREGPMSWSEAHKMIQVLAADESLPAFGCPIDRIIEEYHSQGHLLFHPEKKKLAAGVTLPKAAAPKMVIRRREHSDAQTCGQLINPPEIHTHRISGDGITDHPARMPEGQTLPVLEELLDFMDSRFHNPQKVFTYLRNRYGCQNDKGFKPWCFPVCSDLMREIASSFPEQSLDRFFDWAIGTDRGWYSTSERYEEPVNAVFTLPAVAEFLSKRFNYSEKEIGDRLFMEFSGGSQGHNPTPPCLWTHPKGVCTRGLDGGNICCDFYLKPAWRDPWSATVFEVKVAVQQNYKPAGGVFDEFKKDLAKCRRWLRLAPEKYASFEVRRFDYAVAILIDLTNSSECSGRWRNEINEEGYRGEGIIARLISPASPVHTDEASN